MDWSCSSNDGTDHSGDTFAHDVRLRSSTPASRAKQSRSTWISTPSKSRVARRASCEPSRLLRKWSTSATGTANANPRPWEVGAMYKGKQGKDFKGKGGGGNRAYRGATCDFAETGSSAQMGESPSWSARTITKTNMFSPTRLGGALLGASLEALRAWDGHPVSRTGSIADPGTRQQAQLEAERLGRGRHITRAIIDRLRTRHTLLNAAQDWKHCSRPVTLKRDLRSASREVKPSHGRECGGAICR